MSVNPPDGFFTRPDAATRYNRSQRALERDLDQALATGDRAVLAHWKLVTKDGNVRGAKDVTTEQVKQLVQEGQTPAWCVEGAYLEEQFGVKGSPKRRKTRHTDDQFSDSTASQSHVKPNESSGEEGSGPATLPNDTRFLKERILTLEREKQDEARRNAEREAKLFEQLAVKDRQISAWDEVTQGLTKALATGQLVPSLLPASPEEPKTPADTTATDADNPPTYHQTPSKTRTSSKRTPAKKRTKKKSQPPPPKSVFEKHTPTFHRAVKGLLRRS